MSYLRAIRAAELALDDVLELAGDHVFAECRYTIDKHGSLQVVELMLHHTSQIATYPFVVLLEVLVHVFHMDAGRAHHLLADAWDGEATLVGGVLVLIIILQDVGVDKGMAESLVLWEVVAQYVEVDDHEADGFAYLWSCETDAIAGVEGLVHIVDKLFEFWIIGCDVFSHFSQNRLTIYINR